MDSKRGSSGSPICLINNSKVIGIHKSGIKEFKTNYGTFIGFIVEVLQEKIKIILAPRYVDNFQSKDYVFHDFQAQFLKLNLEQEREKKMFGYIR